MKTAKKSSVGNKNEEYKVIKTTEKAIGLIREKLGDSVLWYFDDETNELFLIEKPESFTKALRGLGKEIWREEGGIKTSEI